MGRKRKVFGAVVGIPLLVVVALVAGVMLGYVAVPSGGVDDVGDWGQVSGERTEVITTVWVRNPNPVGIDTGASVEGTYEIRLNDVRLARGQKEGLSVESGNNTIELSTYLLNENLDDWWVAFLRNDETITASVSGSLRFDAGRRSVEIPFPSYERTMLANETPVIDSLSRAAAAAEGRYARSVSVGSGPTSRSVTAGYELRRAWATWGNVSRNRTTVLFHFRLHNPGDIPVPAAPSGVGVSVEMNDVRLFRGDTGAFSLRDVGPDTLIPPGETKEVTVSLTMDNEKVDDWFTSHVRRGERTTLAVGLQLVFEEPRSGAEFRLPEDGPATYRCELRTGILVDGQETSTDCGGAPASAGG